MYLFSCIEERPYIPASFFSITQRWAWGQNGAAKLVFYLKPSFLLITLYSLHTSTAGVAFPCYVIVNRYAFNSCTHKPIWTSLNTHHTALKLCSIKCDLEKKKELWSGDFFFLLSKVMGKWRSRGERKGSAVLQVSSQLSTPAYWKPSLPYPLQKINYPGTPGWWWWISVWQTTETTLTKITGHKTAKNLGDFISAKLVFHDFFSPWELPLARQKSRFPHIDELVSVIRTTNTYEGGTEFAPSFCSSPRMAHSVCYPNS